MDYFSEFRKSWEGCQQPMRKPQLQQSLDLLEVPAVVTQRKLYRQDDFPPPTPGSLQEVCYNNHISCIPTTPWSEQVHTYKAGPLGDKGRFGWFKLGSTPAEAVLQALAEMEYWRERRDGRDSEETGEDDQVHAPSSAGCG